MVALVTWALVLALAQDGQRHARQHANNADDHEQLNERKPGPGPLNRLNAEFIEGILCDRAIRGLTAIRMRLPARTGRKVPAGETTSIRCRQPVDDHLTGRRRGKLL